MVRSSKGSDLVLKGVPVVKRSAAQPKETMAWSNKRAKPKGAMAGASRKPGGPGPAAKQHKFQQTVQLLLQRLLRSFVRHSVKTAAHLATSSPARRDVTAISSSTVSIALLRVRSVEKCNKR